MYLNCMMRFKKTSLETAWFRKEKKFFTAKTNAIGAKAARVLSAGLVGFSFLYIKIGN